MKNWVISEDKNNELVLSSRIRLARNINKTPFPHKLDDKGGREIVEQVNAAFYNSKHLEENYKTINLWQEDSIRNKMYFERHLISLNGINNANKAAFILSKDETVSIMINEEDHLRIQCINGGYGLEKAYDTADKLDSLLEEKLEYAFDESLGYLTACPTNLGTGLRASVMVHLPALSMNNEMNGVLSALSQVGMTIRGLYGEGSDVKGNLYQISNQITLGLSEEEIINNVKAVVDQLISKELIARENLMKYYKLEIEDKIFRALGTLKSAVLISTSECLKLLSDVRLGTELDIIKDVSKSQLNNLLIDIQPATLHCNSHENLSEKQLNHKRAKHVREKLNEVYIP